jgi:hypothetical protein
MENVLLQTMNIRTKYTLWLVQVSVTSMYVHQNCVVHTLLTTSYITEHCRLLKLQKI